MTNHRLELLRDLYSRMVTIRLAEERLADLVTAGEVGCPCHLYIGQEAIAAGVCAALETDDTVWGGHRSHGHYLAKGGDLGAMFAEIFGKVLGCAEGRGGSMHLLATDVGILGTVPIVAATIPLATGAALASKLRRDGRVAIAFFGDGAMEEGHCHESMNLAALYALPIVFVCENNFYASHMALTGRRAADNLVTAADAHAMPGEVVDGNDAVAVYDAAVRAVARARAGVGPTLLECRTFRWRGHVGPSWDMDVGVKRRDELQQWLDRDPIRLLRRVMESAGVAGAAFDEVDERVRAEIRAAEAFARSAPCPPADELDTHVYATGAR
ncbi:MAG: thiamine pyrophosphate-dependent dehydrogenase E1 component subunit alpha [Acidobacteria bacterium]|nr:thiamine pyrophosphate-dependent dehydrogenase E1 component subunit alpha [Acidobacteriota bacterium]